MSWNFDHQLRILSSAYRSGTLELVSLIEHMTRAGNSTRHARAALNEVQGILKELDGFADEWIGQNIPAAYRQGWDDSFNSTLQATPAGFGSEIKYSSFAQINRQAVEVVAYNLQDTLRGATRMVGRQANDVFRHVGLMATQQRLITGEAIAKTTGQMRERFVSQGITAFEDKLGRMWNLDSYCTMVARTTTREATTLGSINRITAGGYDLVQISEHHPTCEKCSGLAGKVFSLSGNTPGYPRYQDYIPVHGNCLHVLWSYQAKFDPDPEKTKAFSNTSLTEDPRSDAEKRAYKATQDKKRQERDLREQYKRYVARLGKDEVGTIQSFARSKKADSDRWGQMQEDYRDAREGAVARAEIQNYSKDFILMPNGGRIELTPAPASQLKSKQFIEDSLKQAESTGADFSGVRVINVEATEKSAPGINAFIMVTDPEDRIFLLASDIKDQASQAKNGLGQIYQQHNLTNKISSLDRLDELEEFTKKSLLHELGHIKTKHITGNYLKYDYDDWKNVGLEDYLIQAATINQQPMDARLLGEWIAEDYRLSYDPDSAYPHTHAYEHDLLNPAVAESRRILLRRVLK